jgi:NAD(P)-dependent dehydrogenase (short-subunit alcohol dehydrogenase family)
MTGRAVLVTGASRGVDRAIATRFARDGDRVAVHHGDSAALGQSLAVALAPYGIAVAPVAST